MPVAGSGIMNSRGVACLSPAKGCFAPPVYLIRLPETQEITP